MCGLVGYIPNKKKQVNLLRFKSLLIYNEDRGKLSTGIYNIDGIKKDTIKASTFAKDQEWNALTKNSIFLGHTRQPSVGYKVSLAGAQPIEMDNIVMIHNGSIYNKEALANRYDVKCETDDTDSVVMAKILNKKEFGVLNNYNGAAALVWIYKDDPNTLFFYKGASKKTSYAKVSIDERPLYKMTTAEGFYFSSLEDSLENIALHDGEIESIEDVTENMVYSVNTKDLNNITEVFQVTRESDQEKVVPKKKSNHSNKNYSRDYWDDEEYYHGYGGYGCKLRKKEANTAKGKQMSFGGCDFDQAVSDLSKEEEFISYVDAFNESDNDITDERINKRIMGSSLIYFNKGRYWFNGAICQGIFSTTPAGTTDRDEDLYTFVSGVLLRKENEDRYARILDLINTRELKFGSLDWAKLVGMHSDQPIPYYSKENHCIMHLLGTVECFDGRYSPEFFSRGIYVYNQGYFMIGSDKLDADTIFKDDVVSLHLDGEHVLVTGTSYAGFWAKSADCAGTVWYRWDEVGSIILDDEDIIDIPPEDVVDADEPDDDIGDDKEDAMDIIAELDDDLTDAVAKLKMCTDKDLEETITSLIEEIDKFRTNNIVL